MDSYTIRTHGGDFDVPVIKSTGYQRAPNLRPGFAGAFRCPNPHCDQIHLAFSPDQTQRGDDGVTIGGVVLTPEEASRYIGLLIAAGGQVPQ